MPKARSRVRDRGKANAGSDKGRSLVDRRITRPDRRAIRRAGKHKAAEGGWNEKAPEGAWNGRHPKVPGLKRHLKVPGV